MTRHLSTARCGIVGFCECTEKVVAWCVTHRIGHREVAVVGPRPVGLGLHPMPDTNLDSFVARYANVKEALVLLEKHQMLLVGAAREHHRAQCGDEIVAT